MSGPVTQNTCFSDQGIILSVGIVCGNNRTQIVLPMGVNDTTILGPTTLAVDCIESAITHLIPKITACMGSDAYISFLNGEGMNDGILPSRVDFGATAHPGTISPPSMPDSTCSLITFYGDPASYEPGARIHTARTFLPGLPTSAWDGTSISGAQITVLEDLGLALQNGWDSSGSTGATWQRFMNAPRPRGPSVELKKIANWVSRGWVGTQRRRMLPH